MRSHDWDLGVKTCGFQRQMSRAMTISAQATATRLQRSSPQQCHSVWGMFQNSLRSLLLLLTLFLVSVNYQVQYLLPGHLPHLSLHLLSFFLPLIHHFPKVYRDHSARVFINVRREQRLEETELFSFSSLLTLQKPLLYKLGFWDWKGRRKGSLRGNGAFTNKHFNSQFETQICVIVICLISMYFVQVILLSTRYTELQSTPYQGITIWVENVSLYK